MKKLLSILLMVLLVFTVNSQFTRAAGYAPVDITVTSNFGSDNTTQNHVNGNGYGSTLALQNKIGDQTGDYSFAYWAVNDVLSPSLLETNVFDVTSDMDIDVYFTKTAEHLAIFVDSNGNVLHFEYVANAGDVTDPTITTPDKPGMTVADPKWDNALTNITEDTIFVLQYENDGSHNTADLVVTAGTESTAVIAGSGTYTFNEVVTLVTPPVEGGLFFHYWEDTETGEILSYDAEYQFSVFSNRDIVAVFDVVPPLQTSIVANADVITVRDGYETIISQFEIQGALELVEYGVITNDTYEMFDIHTEGIARYQGDIYNPETNEFVTSVVDADIAARSYLVLRDSEDNISVVYSNVYNLGDTYLLDMEFSKTSYTTGTVTIDGNDWEFNDSLTGNEYSVSGKSARVRGYIESQFTFLAGVEKVEFYGRQFSGDSGVTVEIQYALASAPETWITVQEDGSDIVMSLTDTIQFFSVELDIQQECYVRLVKTSGTRANIDNLSIYSYPKGGYSDTMGPIISGVEDASIETGETFDDLAGVTVSDNVDGTIANSNITVTVTDSNSDPVTTTDYSDLVVGTYTISYSVFDAASNEGTASLTLTVTAVTAGTYGDDLFFSQYTESSSKKAIEIYNPTDASIDLSEYHVCRFSNGGSTCGKITLTGTLAAGDVFVITNGDTIFSAVEDLDSGNISHNGNDVYQLIKDTTVLDTLGQKGSSSYYGEDITLTRKSTVIDGNTTWAIGEWTESVKDSADGFGSHTCDAPSAT